MTPASRPAPRPPRLARWILAVTLHRDDRAPALADLDEEFDSRVARDGRKSALRWYRTQARQSLAPALARRWAPRTGGPGLVTELRWAWGGVRARRAGGILHAGLVAIAVGASAVVFSATDAFVFRPGSYPNADRLVVFERQTSVGQTDYLLPEELAEWRLRTDLFSRLYPHSVMTPALFLPMDGITEAVVVHDVVPGLFEALGVMPRWGRPLVAGDAMPDAEPVALVSASLSRRLFGSPGAALGQVIRGEGITVRVVGVMPPTFRFPTAREDIWRPLNEADLVGTTPSGQVRRMIPSVVAAVRPGVSLDTVRQAVAARAAGPRVSPQNEPARAVPLSLVQKDPRAITNSGAFTPAGTSRLFVLLFGLSLSLALITCLNVAGVELASAMRRTPVYAVQTMLGASRATIVRGLLIEGGMLTILGTLAGVALAHWGAVSLSAALPVPLAAVLVNPIDVDPRVAGLVGTLAFGAWLGTSAPLVWRATRLDAAGSLRGRASTSTQSRAQAAIRHLLMTGQVALSVLLLVVAVLFLRTYADELGADPGFDTANLATVRIVQPRTATRSERDLEAELIGRLRLHAGIVAVSRTNRLLPDQRGGSAAPIWRDGESTPAGSAALATFSVDPDYFETVGLRLLGGRLPAAGDPRSHVVVDEWFARRFWPDGNAIGARFSTGRRPADEPYEIVGVSARIKLDASEAPQGGEFFVAHRLTDPANPTLVYVVRLRTAAALNDVAALIRAIADGCLVRVETMDERYVRAHGDLRIAASLTSVFGAVAFLVAMVGLYGVASFLVTSRTKEIGIRVALGAGRGDIRRLVLAPALRVVTMGVAIGALAAVVVSRVVGSQVPGLFTGDPLTYAGVIAAVVATSLAATWRPSRQAAALDPLKALRIE